MMKVKRRDETRNGRMKNEDWKNEGMEEWKNERQTLSDDDNEMG